MKRTFCTAIRIAIAGVFCTAATILAQPAGQAAGEQPARGYRIEEPGTITFTVGVKIKGKVEKPQVMIFLPKEKPYYREVEFTHSFTDAIMEPQPFQPLIE